MGGKKGGRRLCHLFLILGWYLKVQKEKKNIHKVHLFAGNVVTFSKPHITTLKASLNSVSQSFITWQNVRGRKMFSCVNGWDTYCDRAN